MNINIVQILLSEKSDEKAEILRAYRRRINNTESEEELHGIALEIQANLRNEVDHDEVMQYRASAPLWYVLVTGVAIGSGSPGLFLAATVIHFAEKYYEARRHEDSDENFNKNFSSSEYREKLALLMSKAIYKASKNKGA